MIERSKTLLDILVAKGLYLNGSDTHINEFLPLRVEFVSASSYHIKDKLIILKIMTIMIANGCCEILIICLQTCLHEIHTLMIRKVNFYHLFQQKGLEVILKVGKAIIKTFCKSASNSNSLVSFCSQPDKIVCNVLYPFPENLCMNIGWQSKSLLNIREVEGFIFIAFCFIITCSIGP